MARENVSSKGIAKIVRKSDLDKRIAKIKKSVDVMPLSAFFPSDIELLMALNRPNWRYTVFSFEDLEALEDRIAAYKARQEVFDRIRGSLSVFME